MPDSGIFSEDTAKALKQLEKLERGVLLDVRRVTFWSERGRFYLVTPANTRRLEKGAPAPV